MNVPKDKLKKNTLIALGAIFAISLYFAGFFKAIIATHTIVYNPFTMIKCCFQYGFPWGWFFLLFATLGAMLGYYYIHQLRETEGMDKMGRLFKQTTKRQSYGSSHFEDPEEYESVAVIQSPEKAFGTILGQLDDSGKHLINFRMDKENRLNSHIAVVGASGSGKTYTFSKPYCFQTVKRRESIVISDPDGGLYRDMAGYFEDNGYIVRRFDLKNLAKSDGWDCLRSISKETAELDAQMFAQAVISNVVDDPNSIYGTGPMSLLKALILRVYLGHDFAPEEKNIGTVYSLIQNPGGEEFLDQMFNADLLTPEEMPCLGPYLSFKQGSPNLRGNLITNLSVQLQLLQNQMVRKVLSTNDIDLLLPGTQPCAYFCLAPDSHDTFGFIVSLFFTMLFIKLIDFADNQPDGKLPIPVNFLMDEFPSIGKLPDWDRKMATIRKRAMNVVMIFQNIMQLQHLYEDSWTTILSNCATMLTLGINDGDTSDLVAKRIGETTIEVKTERHAAMESIFTYMRANNSGEGKRSLLSYDELFKLGENDSIIVFQNHNPIWARKYPNVLHPDAKKLRSILPQEIPDITDEEARQARREAEEHRVAAYLEAHPLSEVDRSYAGVCEPDPPETTSEGIKRVAQETVLKLADKIEKFGGVLEEAMKKKEDTEDEVEGPQFEGEILCGGAFVSDEDFEDFVIPVMPEKKEDAETEEDNLREETTAVSGNNTFEENSSVAPDFERKETPEVEESTDHFSTDNAGLESNTNTILSYGEIADNELDLEFSFDSSIDLGDSLFKSEPKKEKPSTKPSVETNGLEGMPVGEAVRTAKEATREPQAASHAGQTVQPNNREDQPTRSSTQISQTSQINTQVNQPVEINSQANQTNKAETTSAQKQTNKRNSQILGLGANVRFNSTPITVEDKNLPTSVPPKKKKPTASN